MCFLGCERDPWAGQGSDAATKPLLSLVSCVHQIRGHLSLINYTLIAPHEQPVLLVCLTAQWQKEIFFFFFLPQQTKISPVVAGTGLSSPCPVTSLVAPFWNLRNIRELLNLPGAGGHLWNCYIYYISYKSEWF